MATGEQRSRVVLVALGVLLAATAGSDRAAGKVNALPGGNAPSHVVLTEAKAGEQPLVVEGQVLRPDGRTPAPGIVLYVYQTDTTGRYSARPGDPPRLRAWVRTDSDGRYAYRTIRPAPYPGRRIPAHVHVQLWGDGAPPQWGTTLEFADDPLLGPIERQKSVALGRFANVCAPSLDAQKVQHCRHDLRIKPDGDPFEPSTRHGFTVSGRPR